MSQVNKFKLKYYQEKSIRELEVTIIKVVRIVTNPIENITTKKQRRSRNIRTSCLIMVR